MYRDRLGAPSHGRLPAARTIGACASTSTPTWASGRRRSGARDRRCAAAARDLRQRGVRRARGTTQSMAVTVALAADLGLAVGAHPGYPDREGFGRRQLDLTPDELRATLTEQLAAARCGCSARGTDAHPCQGARRAVQRRREGPRAARDHRGAAHGHRPASWRLFGPPGSALLAAAGGAGLRSVAEGVRRPALRAGWDAPSAPLEGALLGLARAGREPGRSISRPGRA